MPGHQHLFVRDEVFPSWYPNALQAFISSAALNFRLRLAAGSTTTIEVPAADPEIAAIGVNGPWRYNAATVQRAHPGGAAGTYSVFVTAKANDIRDAPQPYSDFTDYSFALDIRATGITPPIVAGVVDMYRKVGEVDWDGAQIVAIRQLVGSLLATDPLTPTAASAAETPLRVIGAAGQTADYLRVETSLGGTVLRVDAAQNLRAIQDVIANNAAVDQVALSNVGGAAAVTFGATADASIRRPSAGVLRTDAGVSLGATASPGAGALYVLNDVTARQGSAAAALLGSIAGAGGVQFGGDTELTRGSAGVLRTGGIVNAIGGFQVNNVALAASHLSNGVIGSGNVVLRTSPDLLGIPTAPTAAQDTAGQQLATVGYVLGQAAAVAPLMDGSQALGASLRYARADHVHPTDTSRAAQLNPAVSGSLTAANDITAWTGNALQVRIGNRSGAAAIQFGSALDAEIHRVGANQLRTTGTLQADGFVVVNSGNAALQSTQSAGLNVLQNMLVGGDSQPAFRIRGDGHISWGVGGSTAPDTTLARSWTGELTLSNRLLTQTGISVLATSGSSYPAAFQAAQSAGQLLRNVLVGDTQPRFQIDWDGKQSWGPGGAGAVDTTLQRNGVSVLGTNFAFQAGGYIDAAVGGSDWVRVAAPAGGGKITFGSLGDAEIHRGGAGILQTSNIMEAAEFRAHNAATGSDGQFTAFTPPGFQSFVMFQPAGGLPIFRIDGDGSLHWGAGGAAADTNLSRDSAGVLRTGGSGLIVDNALSAASVASSGNVTAQNSIGVGSLYTAAAGRLSASGALGELSLLGRDRSSWTETGAGRWSIYANANNLYNWTNGAVQFVLGLNGNPWFNRNSGGGPNPVDPSGTHLAPGWTHAADPLYSLSRTSMSLSFGSIGAGDENLINTALTRLYDYMMTLTWELQRTGIVRGSLG